MILKFGRIFTHACRDSPFDIYRRMWSFMTTPEHMDEVMMGSNAQGVEKVFKAEGF